jgi:hypothetical protein
MLQRYTDLGPGHPEHGRIGMRVEHGQIDIGRTDRDDRTTAELQSDSRPWCRVHLVDTEHGPARTGHRQTAIDEPRKGSDTEAGCRYRGKT